MTVSSASMSVDEALERREMRSCSGCGFPIWWGRFAESGKTVPLDFEPVEGGDLAAVAVGPDPHREGSVVWIGPYQPAEDPDGTELRWVSHFASCPKKKPAAGR